MPKARNGQRARNATSMTSDAALLAADRVLGKESDYRTNIRRIQAAACLLAERITHRGDVETALLSGDGVKQDEETVTAEKERMIGFLTEQRDRLKDIAKGNVTRNRNVDTFLTAVKDVRDEILVKQQERATVQENGNGGAAAASDILEDDSHDDYERLILSKIDDMERKEREDDEEDGEIDLYDEEMCREMRKRLGEKEKKRKRSRGGTRRSIAGGDDSDEDLEVMGNNATDSGQCLKCPITGMYFEDPVKNKVCGHTYSRAGIAQSLKAKKKNCPVFGCSNNNVQKDQLEEDLEMAMKVKRFKRREEQERETQAKMEEDEYEDEDEYGITVIE